MHVHACTLGINVRESMHLNEFNEQTDRNQFRRLTSVHALIVRRWALNTNAPIKIHDKPHVLAREAMRPAFEKVTALKKTQEPATIIPVLTGPSTGRVLFREEYDTNEHQRRPARCVQHAQNCYHRSQARGQARAQKIVGVLSSLCTRL